MGKIFNTNYSSFALAKSYKHMSVEETTGISAKNFNLTQSQFEELSNELIAGNETIFQQIFLSNFEKSMHYLIVKFQATEEEAYDVVMNVLLEFRVRIIQSKVSYGNLNYLFNQMCTQRYQRSKGKSIKTSELIDGYSESIVDSTEGELQEENYKLMQKAIEKLGENCQLLLQRIYFEELSYQELEKTLKTNAASLRKQKERCITKLKMLIRQTINY